MPQPADIIAEATAGPSSTGHRAKAPKPRASKPDPILGSEPPKKKRRVGKRDELDDLKVEIRAIVQAVRVRHPGVRQRYAMVCYRDTTDAYVTRETPFTEDLDAFMARLVKDGDSLYQHNDEGPDDMAAHIRTVLTQSTLSIPVQKAKCDLGIWQGIFLCEFDGPRTRRVTVQTIEDTPVSGR